MGNPKKQKKKFSKPSHPWQKERILSEKELLKSYGLRRKYEIWKMNSILKNFTKQAKTLITLTTKQSEKERSQLLTKLSSLGLLSSESKLEDVLSLTLKDVLERRIQTLVFKKNLARNIKQARQFIVHEHISIKDKKITTPSYLVLLSEENELQFAQTSSLADPAHPERLIPEKKKEAKASKTKKESETESKEPEKKDKKESKSEAKEEKKQEKEDKKEEKKESKSKESKEDKKQAKEDTPKKEAKEEQK